jgi:hypothetical protein
MMAFATDQSVMIWDFATSKPLASFEFAGKISPVLVKVVSGINGLVTILLQDKMGRIYILSYD